MHFGTCWGQRPSRTQSGAAALWAGASRKSCACATQFRSAAIASSVQSAVKLQFLWLGCRHRMDADGGYQWTMADIRPMGSGAPVRKTALPLNWIASGGRRGNTTRAGLGGNTTPGAAWLGGAQAPRPARPSQPRIRDARKPQQSHGPWRGPPHCRTGLATRRSPEDRLLGGWQTRGRTSGIADGNSSRR